MVSNTCLVNFNYRDNSYQLVRGISDRPYLHTVFVTGKPYSILGNAQFLSDIVELFQAASFESIYSEEDIQGRLSTLKGVTVDLERDKNLTEKDGGIWKCIRREWNGYGYTYVFKLDDEYNICKFKDQDRDALTKKLEQKLEELYPALEPYTYNDVYFSFESATYFGKGKLFKSLGYQMGFSESGLYLYLPDCESLHGKWKELQMDDPELPDLNVISSEGVADHLTYVKMFLKYSAVLSSGREYLHDHYGHVSRIILQLLLSPSEYLENLALARNMVADLVQKIEQAKELMEQGTEILSAEEQAFLKDNMVILEANLGTACDVLYAPSSGDTEFLLQILSQFDQTSYFKKFFGNTPKKDVNPRDLWNLIEKLASVKS